jgi:hypothetical protein
MYQTRAPGRMTIAVDDARPADGPPPAVRDPPSAPSRPRAARLRPARPTGPHPDGPGRSPDRSVRPGGPSGCGPRESSVPPGRRVGLPASPPGVPVGPSIPGPFSPAQGWRDPAREPVPSGRRWVRHSMIPLKSLQSPTPCGLEWKGPAGDHRGQDMTRGPGPHHPAPERPHEYDPCDL